MVYPLDIPVQHSLGGFFALWYIHSSMPTSLSLSISSLPTSHGILTLLPHLLWAIIFPKLLRIVLVTSVHHLLDVKCCILGTRSQIDNLSLF